jgi:hypothetical protein
MDRAKEGEIALLYVDASHVVMGGDFPGSIYGRVRRIVKPFSGRKGYTVLGALDFIAKEVTLVTNDSYITACEVCELFRKTAKAYTSKTVFVILDYARYQSVASPENWRNNWALTWYLFRPILPIVTS